MTNFKTSSTDCTFTRNILLVECAMNVAGAKRKPARIFELYWGNSDKRTWKIQAWNVTFIDNKAKTKARSAKLCYCQLGYQFQKCPFVNAFMSQTWRYCFCIICKCTKCCLLKWKYNSNKMYCLKHLIGRSRFHAIKSSRHKKASE